MAALQYTKRDLLLKAGLQPLLARPFLHLPVPYQDHPEPHTR